MQREMLRYYTDRVSEYDEIYAKPERQEDIKALAHHLALLLDGHNILELACGTGFWTRVIANGALSVLATDYSKDVLNVARDRLIDFKNVRTEQSDAFTLENIAPHFSACFAGFWWSHIQRESIDLFLKNLHTKLQSGSLVVFADNRYIPGNSTPIARTDINGNTYQYRQLKNGEKFEILKNFPSETEFSEITTPYSYKICFKEFQYFWCGWYILGYP